MPRVLTAIATSLSLSCTVANPLDYLQADRGAGEGSGPGCPPSQWSECGVTVVASGGRPNAISASTWAIYYSDEEKGSIFEFRCPASTCDTPLEVVKGESPPPLHLANASSHLLWTTETHVRHILLSDTAPWALTVLTADTVNGPTGISGEPSTWSDSAGIRGALSVALTDIDVYWSEATTFLMDPMFAFISGNEVYTCTSTQVGDPCQPAVVPGATGARLLTFDQGLVEYFVQDPDTGLVATFPRDGETEIVHIGKKPADGGTYPVLVRESTPIIAMAAIPNEVYFTTEDGRLRRWRKNSTEVDTLLRGLSANTDVAPLEKQVFVLDREAKQVLRVAL